MPVLAATIGFVIFSAICVVGLLAYYGAVVGPGLYVPPRGFPAPALQTMPLADLEALQAAQRARLEEYGWVDKEKGIVRVPIGRAMQIVAAKGPHALAPLIQYPSQPTAAGLAEETLQGLSQSQSQGGQQ